LSEFWQGKRVVLTGGAGFLGQVIVRLLGERGCEPFVVRSKQYDIRLLEACQRLMVDARPEIVIHAAVHGGGIGYMQTHPAEILYDNLTMNTHMVEASYRAGVEKFVGVGTICSYPKFTPLPFREESLWDGYPEETNAPYGLAKKLMMVQTQAYQQQYGFNGIHLLLVNLYGPGDDFDPNSSHVIPALIRKFVEAKERGDSAVPVWGTGKPSREFLYVDDAALAVVMAAERYCDPEPVNIGAGFEITVADLAKTIARLTGFEGALVFDPTKPDGQPRRALDVTRAEERFGFRALTGFEEGLQSTVSYFLTTLQSSGRTSEAPRHPARA
jgi:GDP-L-fucose synthase